MLRSKAIEIIRTFSPQELKHFKEFLNSPFHNRNKKVIRLFELIRKSAPSFDSPSLAKEKTFARLFPGKAYNDLVMRILISDLIQLSEEFIAYTGWKRNPLSEKKFLLDELKERKLDTLYLKNLKSAKKSLEGSGKIDGYFFFDRFDLENKLIDFLIARDRQDATSANVLKQGENLILFSLITILNITHELLVHKEVLNVSFKSNMVEEYLKNFNIEAFVEYLKENNYEYYQIISIYYYMYMSLIHRENDDYYSALKKNVFDNLPLFTKEEQFNLFMILESNSLGRSHQELMEIYERMLSTKDSILSQRDYMQLNLFRNIFLTACLVGKYEWAEEFLNKHIEWLDPLQREDMQYYAKAQLSFERGNYDQVLESAAKVGLKFFVFKYDTKILMLKAYYELNEPEPALSLADSFAHFIAKNKSVPDLNKERFGNFLRFYRTLWKLSENGDGFLAEKLKKEIMDSPNVISKKWLLEKAEKLNS
jgi:hypothetical protein